MIEEAFAAETLKHLPTPFSEIPLLSKVEVNFTGSANYVNRTKRFVIEVPELKGGGELLVCPEGGPDAGQPIKEQEGGGPDKGVMFYNGKDRVWQAARGNGKETILITDVSSEQAASLMAKKLELSPNGSPLLIEQIKELLEYASRDLGLVDRQDKKKSSVEKEMQVIEQQNPDYMVVTKPTVHQAVYVSSSFIFTDGPVKQTYPEGAVLVTDGKYVWGIDKNVFIRNFRKLAGEQEVELESLEKEFPSLAK